MACDVCVEPLSGTFDARRTTRARGTMRTVCSGMQQELSKSKCSCRLPRSVLWQMRRMCLRCASLWTVWMLVPAADAQILRHGQLKYVLGVMATRCLTESRIRVRSTSALRPKLTRFDPRCVSETPCVFVDALSVWTWQYWESLHSDLLCATAKP
jgi:hypothetical protein